MKALFLVITVLIGIVPVSARQPAEQISVKYGGQSITKNGRISIKFLELVEDSRCAEGVNCVWAGVAKIKVRLSKNGKSSVVELNTNQREKAAVFQGYEFRLKDLDPYPSATAKYSQSAYRAAIAVTKAKR